MDPLSILAGSTGTIAFALSSAQQLYEFVSGIRDAPADVAALSRDVEALTGILETLDGWIKIGVIREQAADSLRDSLNSCVISLGRLDILLRPFTKPLSDTPSLRRWRSSFGWTIRKKEVREARERLLQGKTTLGVTIGIINTYATATGNEELREHIEAGNQALRTDLAAISTQVRDRKELKIINASHQSQKGSLFGGTDCGLPLRKYLEQLPPIDHPWSGAGDIEDVLSLKTFSVIDLDSRPPSPSLRPDDATSYIKPGPVLSTTPLSRAIEEDNIREVVNLLNAGADPNQTLSLGQTCLQRCALQDDHVLAEILLLKGANPLIIDTRGRSALDLALMRCNALTSAILLKHGADMNDFVRFLLTKVDEVHRHPTVTRVITACLRDLADQGDDRLQESFIIALEDLEAPQHLQLRRMLRSLNLGFDLEDELAEGDELNTSDGTDDLTLPGGSSLDILVRNASSIGTELRQKYSWENNNISMAVSTPLSPADTFDLGAPSLSGRPVRSSPTQGAATFVRNFSRLVRDDTALPHHRDVKDTDSTTAIRQTVVDKNSDRPETLSSTKSVTSELSHEEQAFKALRDIRDLDSSHSPTSRRSDSSLSLQRSDSRYSDKIVVEPSPPADEDRHQQQSIHRTSGDEVHGSQDTEVVDDNSEKLSATTLTPIPVLNVTFDWEVPSTSPWTPVPLDALRQQNDQSTNSLMQQTLIGAS